MDEIFALVSDRDAILEPSHILSEEFAPSKNANQGVAIYQGNAGVLWRRQASSLAETELGKQIRGNALVAQASRPSAYDVAPSLANTAPFLRELQGQLWSFVSAGRIPGALKRQDLIGHFPLGDSAAEHVFCRLLDCLREELSEEGHILRQDGVVQRFARKIEALELAETMNFLLSNGTDIIAYGNRPLYFRTALDGAVNTVTVTNRIPHRDDGWACIGSHTVCLLGITGAVAQHDVARSPKTTEPDPRDAWGLGEGDLDYNCG